MLKGLLRFRSLTASDVMSALATHVSDASPTGVEGHGPARYLGALDGSGRRVGFITPISKESCTATSNLPMC